jgi:hypothetical protein
VQLDQVEATVHALGHLLNPILLRVQLVPDILVTGSGGALDGPAATLMRSLQPASGNGSAATTRSSAES